MALPKAMRAAVLYGPGDMRLVDDYPVPVPGTEELLIRVEACAICGTDPTILAQGWPHHPPYGTFIFGHEYTGVVVARGEGVTEFDLGDRVAVEPHKGCGLCNNCRDGLYTICLRYGDVAKGHRHYGFTVNGGYAEYACNHKSSVYRIPPGVSLVEATLVTTAGTSLYGIRRIGGLEAGETVVVSGPGPIGLMAVAMARLLGAGTIILTGTRTERLELGSALGADIMVNVRGTNPAERVMELTDQVGADVVLECAGTEQAANDAVRCIKKGGRIAFVGMYGTEVSLDLNSIVQRNISIAGSKAEGERSLAYAMALLSQRPVNLSALITHQYPLSQIHEAFETARLRLNSAMKVVIRPTKGSTADDPTP